MSMVALTDPAHAWDVAVLESCGNPNAAMAPACGLERKLARTHTTERTNQLRRNHDAAVTLGGTQFMRVPLCHPKRKLRTSGCQAI